MAYITASQFLDRYDPRRVGAMAGDAGAIVSQSDIEAGSNDVVNAALADATGMINSAILRGQRYKVSDLTGLTGDDAAFLYRLTANLAYGLMKLRRDIPLQEGDPYYMALTDLERLSNGDRVFNVDGAIASGVTTTIRLSDDITLISEVAERYFGLDNRNPQPPFS
jgi:hypothetical protein